MEGRLKSGFAPNIGIPLLQGHVSFISYGRYGQLKPPLCVATLTHLAWLGAVRTLLNGCPALLFFYSSSTRFLAVGSALRRSIGIGFLDFSLNPYVPCSIFSSASLMSVSLSFVIIVSPLSSS